MAETRRVLVVGLEAVDPELVERWCAEGRLPALASLCGGGSWRRLETSAPLSSGTIWCSIHTGLNPAQHGMFFFHRQLRPGSYEIRKRYDNEVDCDPFWSRLSREGRRVAVLSAPASRLERDLNGVQLAAWGSQAPISKLSSSPPEFAGEVMARFGAHPLDDWYEERPEGIAAWRRHLDAFRAGVRSRTALARWTLQREAWDLAYLVYPEAHVTGHLGWHVRDPDHPLHDPALAEQLGDPVRTVVEAIDEGIAELMDVAPDATILVVSHSGMGPNYSGLHLLPPVLERLGFSGERSQRGRSALARAAPAARWGANAAWEIERRLSPAAIRRARKLVPVRVWDRWTRRFLGWGSHWAESRAFAIPNDASGAIRVNLRGREPEGRVEPGSEYDDLCAELSEELAALVNPETGEPAVRQVLKVADRYAGEHLDELPDLAIVWRGDAPIRALESPRIGRVEGELRDRRTGAHAPEGFVVARGPGLAQGVRLPMASMLDVAPTLLDWLGVPPANELEGHVLADLRAPGSTGTAAP